MKATTYTKEQMILSDGEVSLYSSNRQTILMSTDKFYNSIGVKIIDRNAFVKGADVEALAATHLVPDYFVKQVNTMSEEWDVYQEYKGLFIAGYNANKNEFTGEQAYELYKLGRVVNFNTALSMVQPLELPASIEVDEMFNVINVKWE